MLCRSSKYFLVFLFILGAVWLFTAAFGVYRGKAWPRGALVVAELLAVIVSFTYMDNALAGVSTLISGAVVLVCLFTPALNEHMAQRRSRDRKSTRLNSSHVAISYAVFCLNKN